MDQDDTALMHLYWKERKATSPEEDLIIFPGEADFLPVPQCTTGRVYQLTFKSSEQKLFFWMQAKSPEKDEEIALKVNRLINDPQSILREERSEGGIGGGNLDMASLLGGNAEGLSGLNQVELLQYLQTVGGQGGTIQSSVPAPGNGPGNQPNLTSSSPLTSATGFQPSQRLTSASGVGGDQPSVFSQDQLSNLRTMLAGIQVPEGQNTTDVDLANVLTPSAITNLLNDPEIVSALFPHLPPLPQAPTAQDLRDTVSSPQFQQALHSLTIALQSGQLGPLVAQLGLPPEAGQSVEGFLRAIEEQARRGGDQGGDSMDTD
jgi:hypothetical protein